MTVAGLAAVVGLILANGYFVAAEFAYVAARRTRLDQLAEEGDRRARAALHVTRRLSFMLSGAQFGITATSLLVGYIAEPTLGRLLTPLFTLAGVGDAAAGGLGFTAGFVVATAAQMVFGELGPKNLAIARPVPVALALAGVTSWYLRLAGPLVRLFDGASNRLLRLIGVEPVEELAGGVSPEELEHIIVESGREGALSPTQARRLGRVLKFRSLRAGDAMVPRTNIDAIGPQATCQDLRRLAVGSGHSRFLVVTEDVDDVLGVVQAKDVLRVPTGARESTPIASLVQPVLAVPESALLGPLLGDMRRSRSPLALVVDEHGGTAGIVTIEDVVEELVGEIRDEYDPAEPAVVRLPGGRWRIPGAWRLDEAERDTGVALPPGPYDTVGGLVMERLGRMPVPGDVIELGEGRLVVVDMAGLAVGHVVLTPRSERTGAST